jgi:hypothetical protein
MPSLKLNVPRLTDVGDVERIVAALRARPGVFGVVGCARSSCVEIDFEDDEVAPDQLIEVIRETGFEAVLAG